MDIDRISFYPYLLDLLTNISQCHFVALDLELSGVPSRADPYAPSHNPQHGKPTLQQRYLETKAAAETYTILQIGVTPVQQVLDHDSEGNVTGWKYICQPYNLNLDPIVKERLSVERVFSFQSGAVEFLLKVGYDIGKPFTDGVPYLSRDEAKDARDRAARRQDRNALADMPIKSTDTETLEFMKRARREIHEWKKAGKNDYVNIAPLDDNIEMSRFEKRLVHQLVRAEYPELVSVGRKGFVQIVCFDQGREDRDAEQRQKESRERVDRQKGFSWVIEALAGGDISGIPLQEVGRSPTTGERIFCDMDGYRSQHRAAEAALSRRPRVLVGHNCFLDLVYIYRTFIGALPDTVQEFAKLIHGIWPMVVDTKYLATHNCGDISPTSSLEDIADKMTAEASEPSWAGPKVECDKCHDKYDSATASHEAGYDSLLTAQIVARLSWKLETEGNYLEVEEDDGSEGGVELNGHDETNTDGLVGKVKEMVLAPVKSITSASTTLPIAAATTPSNGQKDPAAPAIVSTIRNKPVGLIPSVLGYPRKLHGDPALGPDPSACKSEYPAPVFHDPDIDLNSGIEGGVPGWHGDFWRVYGNKLRVFGTQEGVCHII